MSNEIKVSVVSYGEHRNLMLVYFDPITGKKVAKSSGTRDERAATKAAGKWEDELNSGRYVVPGKIAWEDFKKSYLDEKVKSLAPRTAETVYQAFAHVDRLLNPDRLAKLTAAAMSRFQAKLRDTGIRQTSIASILRTLKAAFSWAVRVGLLAKAPKIEMPKRARGQTLSRSRAITEEEYRQLLAVVAEIRPNDTADWQRYFRKTGEPKPIAKYATPHDFRRAFGCRWAKKVTSAVLQRLMRHDDIKTTMAFYVDLDADSLADLLWTNHKPANDTSATPGNTSGNNSPQSRQEEGNAPAP